MLQAREKAEQQDRKLPVEEPLRRSSRKTVKLFNAAALDKEDSLDLEDDASAGSMEGDTEAHGSHRVSRMARNAAH